MLRCIGWTNNLSWAFNVPIISCEWSRTLTVSMNKNNFHFTVSCVYMEVSSPSCALRQCRFVNADCRAICYIHILWTYILWASASIWGSCIPATIFHSFFMTRNFPNEFIEEISRIEALASTLYAKSFLKLFRF